MAKPLPQAPSRASSGNRYSLRTLFLVSGAIAVPLLLLTNVRHKLQPEDSVASPLYLLLGVAMVLLAASIGGALGRRPGMLVAASVAALSWVAVAFLFSEFSKELKAVLPVHVICALAAVAVLAAMAKTGPDSPDEGPHAAIVQLLKVKRDVRTGGQSRDAPPDAHAEQKPDGPAPPDAPNRNGPGTSRP